LRVLRMTVHAIALAVGPPSPPTLDVREESGPLDASQTRARVRVRGSHMKTASPQPHATKSG
jgi:hypothetical protein